MDEKPDREQPLPGSEPPGYAAARGPLPPWEPPAPRAPAEAVRRDGIGTTLAAVLAAAALVVGLVSGLALGVAAGLLLGTRQAQRALTVDQLATVSPRPDQGGAPTDRRPMAPPAPADGRDGPDGAAPAPAPSDAVPGPPEHPYLGVVVATGNGEDAGPGALVLAVQPGTAAQRAGLRDGDRIVALDDQPVASGAELVVLLSQARAGQEVRLTLLRGSEQEVVTATLGVRPGVVPVVPGQPGFEELLEQMPPELREHFRRLLEPDAGEPEAA